jgi:hypothetical protein
LKLAIQAMVLIGAICFFTGVCAAGEVAAAHQLLKAKRDFDGVADVVEMKLPNTVRTCDQMTVTAWIYPRVVGGAIWNRGIVTESYRLQLYMESNSEDALALETMGPLVCSLYTADDGDRWSYKRIQSPTRLKPNRWLHVAMTYDRKNLRLYIDGKQVASRPETGRLSPDVRTTQAVVGSTAHWWGNTDFWSGLLCDVNMYERSLGAQYITALAKKRPAIPSAAKTFRSDSSPRWVANGELEGKYRNHTTRSFPMQWYGSNWGNAKCRWLKDADYPHSGKAALMIACDEITTGGISFYQPGARIPLVPGQTYTLSAWMRSDFDIEAQIAISGAGADLAASVKTVRRWQKYTMTGTYTGLTSSGFIIFYYASKRPGNLVIDDIKLVVQESAHKPSR